MSTKIQLRRDTANNWQTANPVLAAGEIGIEIDATPVAVKVGDGTTAWNDLPYLGGSGGGITVEADPVFTASEAAQFLAGDKAKLDSALQSEADPVYLAQKGQPNGCATLDSDGLVPTAQLPAGLGGSITLADLTGAGNLPTTDPLILGALWNDGGTLKISALAVFTGLTAAYNWKASSGNPSPGEGEAGAYNDFIVIEMNVVDADGNNRASEWATLAAAGAGVNLNLTLDDGNGNVYTAPANWRTYSNGNAQLAVDDTQANLDAACALIAGEKVTLTITPVA